MALSVDTTSVPTTAKKKAPEELSLPRLYALRFGYLVVGVGLAVTKWPLFLDAGSWELMEGVVNSMLTAMSLLALLGLRYPVRMLPVLLFESAWTLIWLGAVAAPMWLGQGLDPATARVASTCLWVVIVLAVVPWRYVARRYLTAPGDRWR
jgi:hypothetical protein